ncbi:lipid transporter ATP-binding/permease protein [compost metagenome]
MKLTTVWEGGHELSDRILVLDNGSIVEDGSHAELMEQNGRYADSFHSQASWYEHEADSNFPIDKACNHC